MLRKNCPLEDGVFICESGRSIRMSMKPVLKLSSLISSKWIFFCLYEILWKICNICWQIWNCVPYSDLFWKTKLKFLIMRLIPMKCFSFCSIDDFLNHSFHWHLSPSNSRDIFALTVQGICECIIYFMLQFGKSNILSNKSTL